jgi:predicted phosphate transport protein (TIGR00153 family)
MAGNPLFNQLFGRSPITPIQKHMTVAYETVSQLGPYFEAISAGDWEQAKQVYDKILELESKADDLKSHIRLNLPRSLFMPISRSDLLELLHMQDRIPNRVKDIAGLVMGRQMNFPKEMGPDLLEYVEKSKTTCGFALKALEELDDLVESGFSGKEVDLIHHLITELDLAEHENDNLQVKVRSQLFSIEKSLNPIDVMFLYRVIEWIGDVADHSQTVGNRMMYIISR